MADTDKLALIANVAGSYLRRNSVSIDQIGSVVAAVTRALDNSQKGEGGADGAAPASTEEKRAPAVPIKKSIHRDFIVCLDCGIKAKTLKRHLQSAHGMTPQQYREKWALAKDYPMTAPAYAERRSQMAKALGLGQKMLAARAQKPKRGSKKAA